MPRPLTAAVALVLALAACSPAPAHDTAPSPATAGRAGGGTVAAGPVGELTIVNVLGDSHSSWPGSWYERTVAAGTLAGVAPGVLSSHPGKTSVVLRTWVRETTAGGGTVLIQAGTNDMLLTGSSPDQTAKDVAALVRAVEEAGARPILVSVPPSETLGDEVLEVNSLLSAWARVQGLGWVDVTTCVAMEDGTWLPGMSADGIHANDAGGRRMAKAVLAQLPEVLSAGGD
ncbi:SGNH/GDSL hydrolase family protein [Sinomonas mesophila]|uniref:SGNH/GDSL hydrolase family protein n=1 Tax=Sinomonas mesophila TaxID=1531955 RepID=UPI001588EF38|nr:SGNH/GDSL hydrolase family protein [Sinomonas mesophila]